MKQKQIFDTEVRICPDCGTIYSAKHKRCENCGTRLGEPVDNSDAGYMAACIRNDKSSRDNLIANRGIGGVPNNFPPTPGSGFLGPAAIICAIGYIAVWIWTLISPSDITLPFLSQELIAAIPFINLFAVLLLAGFAIDCYCPSFFWTLDTIAHRIYYKNEPEPSAFSIFCAHATIWILTIAAILWLVAQIVLYLYVIFK